MREMCSGVRKSRNLVNAVRLMQWDLLVSRDLNLTAKERRLPMPYFWIVALMCSNT